MPKELNRQILLAAIDGFEDHKKKIDDQIAEVRAMLSDSPNGSARHSSATPAEPLTDRPRRKMSAATRKKMAEGQRKRWASKVSAEPAAPKAVKKPKRKLSAAGRAAIVAALKKRWAAKKAA